MARKINIGKLLSQIDSFGEDAQREAVSVTNATAEDIVNDARLKAPVDKNQLRLSINNTKAEIGNNRSIIAANAPYSAYVEFGTGGPTIIPKGFEDLASPFKGKDIRKRDYGPKPFLIPAYLQNIPIYRKKLNTSLERQVKKYNAKK